jgi:uncharacterized protein (DUF58 family)
MATIHYLKARQRAERLASTLPPLLIAADRVAATVAQGVHGRRSVGQSETFWQFRRYQTGDAVSKIDWRQSGKNQSVFIRETEWEAAQSVWLWRDTSSSMDYRSSDQLPTKDDRAAMLLLATSSIMMRGGERFTLLGTGIPPASGKAAFNRLSDVVLRENVCAENTPPYEPLPRYAQVVLLGDFLSPLPSLSKAIMEIAAHGVAGQMVQVLDPAEETLPFRGRIRFTDLESEMDALIGRVEAVREGYMHRLADHRAGLRDIARRAGWGFHVHHTDEPPEKMLLTLYTFLAQVVGS